MYKLSKSHLCLAASVLALAIGGGVPAHADDATTLKALQDQINSLQKQLAKVQAAQAKSTKKEAAAAQSAPAAKAAATPAATPVSAPAAVSAATPAAEQANTSSLKGIIKAKTGVDLTLGGYLDVTSIYRTKNQTADVGSNFNTLMPLNDAANAHEGEFRESARATRLSLLATGNPYADTKLTGYFETDFQAAASTSTPTQTNGYAPRLRQGFGEYENSALGLHVLGGQAWSLVTMNKVGMNALDENIPIVIESSYVPGFNFTRGPQVRIMKDFDDKKYWVGVSAEAPQAELNGICTSTSNPSNSPSLGSVACGGWSTSNLVTATGYSSNFQGSLSTDFAPDVVVKASADPGFGHYEVFGLARFFHDQTNSYYHNNYYAAGGGGVAALLPVVPKKIDIQANTMIGRGIGRYGAAQLPDLSITPTGALKPLGEYTAMVGVVGHPDTSWDTFLYAGLEQEFRHNQSNVASDYDSFGYGNFAMNNAACNTGTSAGTGSSTTAACFAQTSSVWQITPGVWKRVYDGNYGKMQIGLQDSWTRRNTFSDAHGTAPHSIENITMLSLRYNPF